jgi:hypothetical protein
MIALTVKSQVKFGLVGGINESTLLTGHETNYYLTGFEAGIASEINLSRHFYLFPELVIISKGEATYDSHLRYLNLNLPILAGYRIQKHIELLAGPTVGYMISVIPDPNHLSDFMRKFEYGFCGTARFRINARTGIDISYLQSFSGIYNSENNVDGQEYTTPAKYNPVNQTFQMSFFYLLL